MKRVFNLLLGSLLLGACSSDFREIPGEISPLVNGNYIITEKVADLSAFGIQEPSGLLKSGQNVIVGDRNNSYNVYRIQLSENTSEGALPRLRTRSGGATIFHSLASDGQGGWTVLDGMRGKLAGAPVLLTRSRNESVVNLPEDMRHLYAVRAGEYVIATGIYPEGRYMLYSPANGQVSYKVDYPEHPLYPELQAKTKAVLFASNVLRARPDGRAFVCADMYSGVMDICRIEGQEINLVKRLIYHYPRVQIREKGEWPRVVYSKDNRFGFTDVCVTEDCIYALYSGLTYRTEKKNFQHCRTLLEIGWDGVVRTTRSVDVALTHLAYDAQEKSLYGIARNPGTNLVRLIWN